jgi:hypothetical protein
MNREVVVNVPFQNDIAVLFGIFAGACVSATFVREDEPTTAKALLDRNLMSGSAAIYGERRLAMITFSLPVPISTAERSTVASARTKRLRESTAIIGRFISNT